MSFINIFIMILIILSFIIIVNYIINRAIIQKIDEVKLFDEKDNRGVKKFAREKLYRYTMTQLGINLISAGVKKNNIAETDFLNKTKIKFTNKNAIKIYDFLGKYMINHDFYGWSIFLLSVMEASHFENQPSVNLIESSTNNVQELNIPYGTTNYKMFAKINLFEHTANVIEKFVEHIKNLKTKMRDRDNDILLLSCLLHDFGKSIELAKVFGIYDKKMKQGKYHHYEASEIIARMYAGSYKDKLLMNNEEYSTDLDRIFNVVVNHHTKGYSHHKIDPITTKLKSIDKAARSAEELKLLKREQERKLEEAKKITRGH